MATLTVEGKQFDLETLSDEVKAIANAVSFTDAKIKQVEQELMMARAARAHYVGELLKSLPNQVEEKKTAAKKATTRKRTTTKSAPAKNATSTAKASTPKPAAAKTSSRSKASTN